MHRSSQQNTLYRLFGWPLLALFLAITPSLACDGLPPTETLHEPSAESSQEPAPNEPSTESKTESSQDSAPIEPSQESTTEISQEPAPSEPSTAETTTEPAPPDQEPAPTESPQESTQDATAEPIAEPDPTDAQEPLPETNTETQPDGLPETQSDGLPETQPDGLPALQVKAISLRTPLLENSAQSGLLERSADGKTWHRILWLPAGSFSFTFQLDKQTAPVGILQQSTWPLQGFLQTATAPIQTNTPQQGRYRITVDTTNASFRIEALPAITAARLVGTWNAQSNQQIALALDAQTGLFQADISIKAGNATFSLELQQQGAWRRYSLTHTPYNAFPQGGTLEENTSPSLSLIPQDDTYRFSIDPKDLRFALHYTPDDPTLRYQALLQDLSTLSDPAQKNARILPFFRRLTALRQIPIVKGRDVVFLLWWSMQAPASVAGTFNQWQAGQHTLQRIAGTDFYHLKLTMTQDSQYAYKFVDSAATPQWITDPVNRRFEYGPFGSNSLFNTDATTDTSTLEQHNEFSATKLQNKRKLIVYLPPNYRSAKTRYPVLYMHDGQNLFDDQAIWGGWGVKSWADQMIKAGQLKPFIVVGVENTIGRMDEYTHTTDKISGTSTGGKANDYADFLLKDIKPYIDGLYRTHPDHRHTAVMGSSLGGLISLWLGVHYPRTFFRIGALSSTFGWGKIAANNPTLGEIFQNKGFQNLVVYIDSGSPQDNYQVTLQMRDTMRQLGYLDDLNLLHYVEQNAIHNEKAWRDRLHRPLSFLLSWP
ncbi:hypothetical protein L6R29_16395 [Myxococcota bacterium]|nr:hypothetical protein [Myxococcota bacterium]